MPIGIKALILMGGTGERFGSTTPKQFHLLAGKKVYLHTLETFLESNLFEEIILVCPPAWIPLVKEEIAHHSLCRVISGGATRQESSFNGILACGNDARLLVIHDAVRPFITREILEENISGALQYGAVDTCIPSADTLVHAPKQMRIESIPNRAEYMRGQTPQSFDYSLIFQAHLEAKKRGICNCSDDCSLVLQSGHPVYVVMGSEHNMKITSELDLFLAEHILQRQGADNPPLLG